MLFENISIALRGLLVNKMRAVLTMLGIIIGIGSVIAIMTVGNSMSTSVATSMQSMGANNITVSLTQKSSSDSTEGSRTRMFMAASYAADDLISTAMIDEYRQAYGDEIYAIGLTESVGSQEIETDADSATVNITGVDAEYTKVEDVTIVNGRFIDDAKDSGRQVAVVSDVFANALFPMTDPIGQEFEYTSNGKIYKFYIIGVYEYESSGTTESSTDTVATTSMYIPLDTAKTMAGADAGYSSFTVVGDTDTDTSTFLTQTKAFFAEFYTRNDSYTVTASSMESMVESMTDMLSTISLAISIIAGISLLVGGIGVMNIMLVSITERTREIGTRKALGASNGNIRIQFIVESMIICLIGGIIGVGIGLGAGAIGSHVMGYATTPNMLVIAVAVTFSMVIGVFFGYYPANKAAKLDPVEALRYE
ncbi:MAG: ABC transporter permease [Oscillospiraceae bacterium]